MSEIRLYVSAGEIDCGTILDLLTVPLEDSEYAIATQEIDEDQDIWEASIYTTKADEAGAHAALDAVVQAHFPDLKIHREVLPEVDWVAKSLEGLKPVRAGRFIVHGSHDRHEVKTGDIAIEIDAGQAFGTGHHGTTAGCLEMIDQVLRAKTIHNALDLGTGSGVLAIAASKVAHIPVLATDIDPIAVRVARENARINNIVTGIDFAAAPGFHHPAFAKHGPFDLIIANILAKPLMGLAPKLANHLNLGGTVILSGILASQRWKVLAAYNAQKLSHVKTIWREGWVTIVLKG